VLTIASDLVTILFYWYIVSVLVVVTVYDLYHFIIPDRLTVYLSLAVIGLLMYNNLYLTSDTAYVMKAGIGSLLGSGFFYLLWKVSAGRWLGFGDVKLAIPLGLLVGPSLVFSFVVLSFWVGAVISLLIIAFQYLKRGQTRLQIGQKAITMKSEVPFAPFLVASSLIIIFTHLDVLALFSFA
jgi:prepilin signal peptidase PulO-like enzyme (type II secretory pathway)